MKTKQNIVIVLMFLVSTCGLCATLSAQQQQAKDTTFIINKGAGIPNSGNTL